MHFEYDNVNDAFYYTIKGFRDETIPTVSSPSRYGAVRYIQQPVIITYHKPWQKVLFNAARDCNPFFHVVEALWMLAGKNDVETVAYYAANMRNFSDDGVTFNGAYGYRWRHKRIELPEISNEKEHVAADYIEVDQLRVIINEFKLRPHSRRVVLQMWDVEQDLLKIDPAVSKDVCCNTEVMFALREADQQEIAERAHNGFLLDVTVINRSNDSVWGMFGANAVHFAFLQEYMAACIGVGIGQYHQFSNNMHYYTANPKMPWTPDEWIAYEEGESQRQYHADFTHFPLVKDPTTFDREVQKFVGLGPRERAVTNWQEPFLQKVASPMVHAFNLHKDRNYDMALKAASLIAADDWRVAAQQWLTKRKTNWEAKQDKL